MIRILRRLLGIGLVVLYGPYVTGQMTLPLPDSVQLAWQEAEMGVVFHYDLHVFDPSLYKQADNRITPIADYDIFHPAQLDIGQWVRTARDAGAKFAILTATHETGFALYQSDVNPYCMKALRWRDGKADLVKEFVDSCRKYGLKPGIYLGIRWNSFFGVHDFKVEGEGEMQKRRQAYYNSMVEGMVREICTRYGPLFEIWFDGGASSPAKGAPDVLPIVRKYQPGCLFYHNDELAQVRWGGSESGTVAYPCWSTFTYKCTGSGESTIPGIARDNYRLLREGDADGKYWMPAMADAPLRGYGGRHEWFWEPGDEKHIYPLTDLVDMYYRSVGRNATLVLGLTPDNRGLLPDEDVRRLRELGDEIRRRFSSPVAAASGKGMSVEIKLEKPQTFNQVVVQENIATGERIRAFVIQARMAGKWKTVLSGTSVGQKYIAVLPSPVKAGAVRLVVTGAIGVPEIKSFMLYDILK